MISEYVQDVVEVAAGDREYEIEEIGADELYITVHGITSTYDEQQVEEVIFDSLRDYWDVKNCGFGHYRLNKPFKY